MKALRARLRRRKIAIVHRDDHNYGARGYGRAIYFRDPDGLLIEARVYPGQTRASPGKSFVNMTY
jgi:hypothetical protein